MNILCCIDRNYLMPLGVSMVSIFENNKNEKVTVHVIAKDFEDYHRSIINDIAKKYNQHICFYSIDPNLLANLPVYDHLTNATYIRLFIADILPENIEKILYMDNDVIVNNSLRELWDTDITSHPAAAVLDSYTCDLEVYNKLHYDKSLGYFNAGVMLINLKYWRENKVLDLAMNYLKENYANILHADQDIMNYLFRENKIILPFKFNAVCTIFYKNWPFDLSLKGQLEEAINNGKFQLTFIVRETGGEKILFKNMS